MRDYLFVATRPSSRDFINLAGQRFGRLSVVEVLPRRDGDPHVYWLCRCDCGKTSCPTSNKLRRGLTVSCGCHSLALRTVRATRHGYGSKRRPFPEYKSYMHMRGRCLNQKNSGYRDYGGRGISICDRWLNGDGIKTGFQCFLQDMGPRPNRSYSLDRIDNNGNYEPANCRWATDTQQARNRRSTRVVNLGGERVALAEACERLGVSFSFINGRMQQGFTFERALAQPARGRAP